jgi:hypothetical protein
MKKQPLEVVRGSGNVYRDFNMPDADARQLKAILAAEIIKTLDKNEISVRKAQGLTIDVKVKIRRAALGENRPSA